MKFLSKNIKKISLTGFLSVFLMFFSTHFTRAGWITDVTAGAFLGWIMGGLGYLVGYIAGGVFWVVGLVVTLALNFNLHITEPGNLIVRSGWDIMLNITNLGFVLAIIVISFATILRFESYAIKKTLWKLIVAALLVNFSLTISGAFIDVANNATKFMMEKSGATTPVAWASAMGGMFKVQKLLEIDKNFDNDLKGLAEGTFSSLITVAASLIFGAVFTFIAAITLFTVGILLFVRYVQLSFLLIFSPIIWLAWIFPATQNYWEMWWKRFLKWTFFAPIMMFFMYLALRTMSGTVASYMAIPANFASKAPFTTPMAVIGQMILVIGIIMGGMFVANAMGIEGANVVYGAASKYGKGWAYRGGQRAMNARVKVPFIGTFGSVNDITAKLSNTRGLKWAGRGLNYLGAGVEKGAAGAMGDYRNYVKGLSKDRLENEILSTGRIISGRNKNIAIEEAVKGNKLTPKAAAELLMDPDKLEAMEKSFTAQNLSFNDVIKTIGVNEKILRAIKEGDNEKLKTEQASFFEKSSPDDIAKSMLAKELYKTDSKFTAVFDPTAVESLQKSFADALIKSNRVGSIHKIFPNLGGDEVTKFAEIIKSASENHPDKKDGVLKALKKATSKRFYGELEEDEEDKGKKGGESKLVDQFGKPMKS